MKKYDLIVIGAGGGTKLRPAADMGFKMAMIEKEDLGGTCLNRGCIPSKMLIHAADVAEEIRNAHKYDLNVDTNFGVNFKDLVTRVTDSVTSSAKSIEKAYNKHENIDLYKGEGRFLDNKTVEVNGEQLTADKIYIATGTRPLIPNIEGLDGTPYMTSREALRNTVQPKTMAVIGGGYIGVELGHFYGALGTDVTFLVRSALMRAEDSEIAAEFSRVFKEKYRVRTSCTAKSVVYKDNKFTVTAIHPEEGEHQLTVDSLMIATGVTPNTENLGLGNTDIETDERGFIKVNSHLETGAPGVYALGDIIGRYLFRHSVNFEGEYLLDEHYITRAGQPIHYSPMPHAVFSNPQIAGVGKTEDQLKEEKNDYIVGLNHYKDSAMGDALRSDHGLVKLMFDKKSRLLLGAHIVGPEASDMIHMLIAYMNMGANLDDLLRTIYIHPALPENVRNAARDAKKKFSNL